MKAMTLIGTVLSTVAVGVALAGCTPVAGTGPIANAAQVDNTVQLNNTAQVDNTAQVNNVAQVNNTIPQSPITHLVQELTIAVQSSFNLAEQPPCCGATCKAKPLTATLSPPMQANRQRSRSALPIVECC